jgi:hypothetical protein
MTLPAVKISLKRVDMPEGASYNQRVCKGPRRFRFDVAVIVYKNARYSTYRTIGQNSFACMKEILRFYPFSWICQLNFRCLYGKLLTLFQGISFHKMSTVDIKRRRGSRLVETVTTTGKLWQILCANSLEDFRSEIYIAITATLPIMNCNR